MARIHSLRDEVATWASQHHSETFIQGIRAFLGPNPDPPSENELLAAVAFSLLCPGSDGPNLYERYRQAVGGKNRADRQLLTMWSGTWMSVLRILDVEPERGLWVHDVLRDRCVFLHERAATRSLAPGHWLLAAYTTVDGRPALEGTAVPLSPSAPIHVVQAGLQALRQAGVAPQDASPEDLGRAARSMIAANHQALRPPRLINGDGHDIEIIEARLALTWKDLLEVVGGWPDAVVQHDQILVFGDNPPEQLGEPAYRGAFSPDDDGVLLVCNSRARLDGILARWKASTGRRLPVLDEAVTTPPSDPDGAPTMIDATLASAEPDEDLHAAEQRFLQGFEQRWADTPIPALDGLSPRDALGQRHPAELWALAPSERAARALGLTLPDTTRDGR